MDARTLGQLIAGFGTKLGAIGVVIWGASHILQYILHVFDPVARALGN
jgi:hypothetical protein